MKTNSSQRRLSRLAAAALALACVAVSASAQDIASLGAVEPAPDPRIRLITYNEDAIVPLTGDVGYQMLIEFDEGERIENVAIGDSMAWQVTPNRAATLLFLKPLSADGETNMTVVTTLRRYTFELSARDRGDREQSDTVYVVRFSYPEEPAAAESVEAEAPPRPVNLNYSVRGNPRFGAVRVFDDGAMTYFQIPEAIDAPAIFVVGESGEEELANTQTRPPFIVVDTLARGFVLRSGRYRVNVRNEAFGTSTQLSENHGARP